MIINKKSILKNKNILETEFIKPGDNTPEIFADTFYLQKQVGEINSVNDINRIIKFIKQNVKRKCDIENHLFKRDSKQIWISGYAESSLDYAMVLESILRQLSIPTIHTELLDLNLKKNKIISTHSVCEALFKGKFILLDPSTNEINEKHKAGSNKFKLKNGHNYEVLFRGTDLSECGIESLDDLVNIKRRNKRNII